jgi:hypothetical protein
MLADELGRWSTHIGGDVALDASRPTARIRASALLRVTGPAFIR